MPFSVVSSYLRFSPLEWEVGGRSPNKPGPPMDDVMEEDRFWNCPSVNEGLGDVSDARECEHKMMTYKP